MKTPIFYGKEPSFGVFFARRLPITGVNNSLTISQHFKIVNYFYDMKMPIFILLRIRY